MTNPLLPLSGKVVLVTGGTRGIGRAVAQHAAELGAAVTLTYRDPAKKSRAQRVARELAQIGADITLARADITLAQDRLALYHTIKQKYGRLDGLVLNAAGGLEAGKGPDYAMIINRDAQLGLVQNALEAALMPPGGWVIYMTSLWAHYWGEMDCLPGYAPVALTKHRAEQDLRAMQPELAARGLKLAVVVGHMITDTGAFAIFRRKDKTLVEQMAREVEGERLPTPPEVARAALLPLAEPGLQNGYTVLVGKPKQQVRQTG